MSKLLVFLFLAAIPFVDSLVSLEMPNSASNLAAGTAVGAGEGGSSRGREIGLGESTSQPKVASATAGFEAWVGGGFAEAACPCPVALPGKGPAAASSPLPDLSRQGTERSKEASYGVGKSEYDDTDMVVSSTHPVSSSEGAGLAVRGIATYYHPSLAGGIMRDGVTRYDPQAIGPIAMTNYTLGTWVEICGTSRRCLMGVVSDTGLLRANHTDVSEAMFRVLVGDLGVGVAPVTVREIE